MVYGNDKKDSIDIDAKKDMSVGNIKLSGSKKKSKISKRNDSDKEDNQSDLSRSKTSSKNLPGKNVKDLNSLKGLKTGKIKTIETTARLN